MDERVKGAKVKGAMMKNLMRLMLVFVAATLMMASAWADVSGTVVRIKHIDAAPLWLTPWAVTVGGYFRSFPAGLVPSRALTEVTVRTRDGQRVTVVQEQAVGVENGASVSVVTQDGRQRVVAR